MRVLVIDLGDEGARRLARTLLAEGYAVDSVDGVVEAVWVCRDSPPQTPGGIAVAVVCVPVAGPAERELCLRLREAGAATPVLVLAGRAGSDDVVATLDSGADDIVCRPIRIPEIVARLRALARREPVVPTPSLVVGDLVLDPGAHRVSRGEEPIDLSPHLFTLLETFARHPGQVLTRAVLVEAVWDPAHEPTSNVVEQSIAALRRRIDAPFGRTTLQTVRGRGYRLDPAA